jgi:hypothetical protein
VKVYRVLYTHQACQSELCTADYTWDLYKTVYNSGLDNWTVVCLTANKFEPFKFLVMSFQSVSQSVCLRFEPSPGLIIRCLLYRDFWCSVMGEGSSLTGGRGCRITGHSICLCQICTIFFILVFYILSIYVYIYTPRLERLWGPPSLLSNGYQGFFPWG